MAANLDPNQRPKGGPMTSPRDAGGGGMSQHNPEDMTGYDITIPGARKSDFRKGYCVEPDLGDTGSDPLNYA